MRHLDLFSGIGGFALAAEMAFGEVEHIFCDNDAFSQAVLRKHWPAAPIYNDIKTLTYADIKKEHGWQSVDLLTGGFPCQPFSSAGRRGGTEDDRHLWPEMLRVIRECNPHVILGENVSGLLTWDGGMVLEEVLSDLEGAGYEAGAFIIPAASVGAPHRRDRVWIAAHARSCDAGGAAGVVPRTKGAARVSQRHQVGQSRVPGAIRPGADTDSVRREGCGTRSGAQGQGGREALYSSRPSADASSGRRREGQPFSGRFPAFKGAVGKEERRGFAYRLSASQWSEEWAAVASRLCAMDDGVPVGVARPRGWRNAALKGAGNAIVPQVAAQILKRMPCLNS